jgi:uncharacterized protein (TIGR00730 family)
VKESTEDITALSRQEMAKLALKRVTEITKEFTEGFKFLEDYSKSVTFFGANQFREDNPYYSDARTLAGRIVKELDYSVLSGGGPGIMEAANRGASEAGGNSLGLLIKLPKAQIVNKYINKEFSLYYFFVRKVFLAFSAEAFIFYPGGFGTLDEFFELLTLKQTKKITNVPLICVGSPYWLEVKKFMEKEMLGRGTIMKDDLELFQILDDHDQIIEIIRNVPIRIGAPLLEAESMLSPNESPRQTL